MKLFYINTSKFLIFSVLILFQTNLFLQAQTQKESIIKWFPEYSFDVVQFKNPAQEFGPFARWWWPGNDVTKEELRREINVFAANAFGGVEIQPFSLNVPMKSEETKAKVLSWDSPEYYENVRAVLDEAQKQNIIVDITNGSGWPAGGSYLKPEDGFLNLLYASKEVTGNQMISIPVPKTDNNTDVPSTLIAIVAAKTRSENNTRETILLDASTKEVLTELVKNDTLTWNAPEGNWKIIAFWSQPNSLLGSMTASPEQGPVLNHFDSVKVINNYEYLFGQRTSFEPYYGNSLRAVFNDSYEFAVDRHFSDDFIAFFKKQRGYDITPWLPGNMQDKYNYASFKNPNNPPAFSFGSEDWRLKYDYDLTLSELLGKHFIGASSHWLEERGMLHRTQVYGMNMDMIANAGFASIPETESMLGQEAIIKVMASGAHLYNRPILSAESVVFSNRGYMTTPQKIKLAVDKLFAAGVNQIIYHGVPYRYITNETTDLGWYPFYMGFISFSSHLGERTQFWKYQKEINEYIARTQYVLRSGKPKADVLIYFPYMTVDGMPDNPEEILTKGFIEGSEPPLPLVMGAETKSEKEIWAEKIYSLINRLEANGITWDWVNDESIQQAKLDGDKQINIRGNLYQSLILADISVIQLKTAEQIEILAKEGMNLLAIGDLPDKQPSFLDWEKNDEQTKQQIISAVNELNSIHIQQENELSSWMKGLNRPVKYNDEYNFIRTLQREMNDGSRIQFIWNKSDGSHPISLTLDDKFENAYWLNAETGVVTRVEGKKEANYILPPYSTIVLYASTSPKIERILLPDDEPVIFGSNEVLKLENWNLTAGDISIQDTSLFNWKNHEQLKFSSEEGIYKTSFQIEKLNKKESYFIDLGKVYFTAEIFINNKPVGKRLFAPYSFNITSFLQKGENIIEVRITPGQLNGLIGEAKKGNPRYKIFLRNENSLLSGGLVGPVKLYKKF